MKIRKKVRRLVFASVALILLAVWLFGNFTIKRTDESLVDVRVNGEIKIALVSDLHIAFYSDCGKIADTVKEANPDLIFVLGDMYSRGQTRKIPDVTEFLDKLSGIAPVYAVTGDHDYDEEYKEAVKKLENVVLLDYNYCDTEVKGNKLRIYGIDNVYFSDTFDLSNEFETPPEDRINILLSHIPSAEHYGDFGFDYIFCGDTHGGMIRLPYLGGLYYRGFILPKITYNGTVTDKGLYELENTSLYVTSGVGNYPLPLRFNCRPEICIFKIKGE